LTPATLIGVSGRPIRASAVSTDNDGDFAGDQWSESGAAQKSVAAAIIPSALKFFIVATPSPLTLSVENRKAFHGISLMQIKSGTTTKNPSRSGWIDPIQALTIPRTRDCASSVPGFHSLRGTVRQTVNATLKTAIAMAIVVAGAVVIHATVHQDHWWYGTALAIAWGATVSWARNFV
jgi:hypothetical protein